MLCKTAGFSLRAVDLADDLPGILGPGEGPRVVVPVVGERPDGGHELLDGGEGAPPDGLAGDDREEAFHEVEPRAAGGREVQGDPGVLHQPGVDLGMLVG